MTEGAPRRLRRAEAVLRRRTARLILVLERPWDDHNVQAVLRTAEAFGIQHIWTVRHPDGGRMSKSVTKGSHRWLTLRRYDAIGDCVDALRREGCALWATDLHDEAECLDAPEVLQPFPERVALVVGREADGVSEEMLAAADRRLWLPMQGFTESFNLSVATALVLQRCFDAEPALVGAMSRQERDALRHDWYRRLAGKSEERRAAYARWAAEPPEPLPDVRPDEAFRRPRIPKKLWNRAGLRRGE